MKLSENIAAIFSCDEDGKTVTVQTILDRTSVKGFGMLLVLFSLPSAMPVPAPGDATPFGIVLFLLGTQLFRNRDQPWLPERVLNRQVTIGAKPRLIKSMIFFLHTLEFFIRPRLSFMFNHLIGLRLLSGMVILCASSMILPIPLTNTAPSFGIFIIGLSILEEDGLMAIGGMMTAFVGLCLSVTVIGAILFFGWEGIELVRQGLDMLKQNLINFF